MTQEEADNLCVAERAGVMQGDKSAIIPGVNICPPKWSGVDFRPAMSFAFTFTESTSLFTRETSPFRQASNSSLKAPPLLPSAGLEAPDPGLETLLPLPPEVVVVEKLALLGSTETGRSGEAGATSIPPAHSLSLSGGTIRAIGGGEPGAAKRELFLGGDCIVLCCCEERRDTAITAAPLRRQ
ncbi:hypothetical protein F7725_012374 [Dissostichus mawsoni]|uniref:Uncharacterized protein n=1 Tax=Dissostichus mawsoni TaxID=36200 RepID=A0A7J5YM53_DISMA|nr:hypothetical protein F7725_012374 [Dissostichus mawsoni]